MKSCWLPRACFHRGLYSTLANAWKRRGAKFSSQPLPYPTIVNSLSGHSKADTSLRWTANFVPSSYELCWVRERLKETQPVRHVDIVHCRENCPGFSLEVWVSELHELSLKVDNSLMGTVAFGHKGVRFREGWLYPNPDSIPRIFTYFKPSCTRHLKDKFILVQFW